MRHPSASLTRSTSERHETKPRTDKDTDVNTHSRTAEANTEPPRPPNARVSHIRVQHVQLYLIHRHAKRGEIEDTVVPNCRRREGTQVRRVGQRLRICVT